MHHFGRFDVILCRNVLMYLNDDKRTHVLEAIAPSMEEGGTLDAGCRRNRHWANAEVSREQSVSRFLRVGAGPARRVTSKSFPHRLILRATVDLPMVAL